MAMLIDGLRTMGATNECTGESGFLPVTVRPGHGLTGGDVLLSRPASSQFVSGLVIAASLARAPSRIVLERGTPARPCIDMTLRCLEAFGGAASWEATS